MTRVVAPSRLHFGLVNAGNIPGIPLFGGCGLMIDSPGVAVRVEPANEWSGVGPCSDRAVAFAKMVTTECHRVTVERCPPEHVGLGVGTSLGLAVAKAVRPSATTAELAKLTGRGLRSGVGLHGFDLGGFIVDGGKDNETALPRLAARHPFPPGWRVVVIVPDQPPAWHGSAEIGAFARLRGSPTAEETARRMRHLLDREIGPAVEAEEYDRFAQAVGEYNRLAGEPFTQEQGGTYAGRVVSALIAAVADLGFPGVGQSSWGPAVLAVCPDPDRAAYLTDVICGRFAGMRSAEVVSAAASGAVVTSM
jgi:beta-ribofuranosylaminobenzene 5'-phosphate synthase